MKDVTVRQLISWGIVQECDGKYIPTNAFALLAGNDVLPTATQCGVFKGTTKAHFVDRREYSGPIQDQVEEALQFVLRNIHLGAEISGIARHDVYEIPVGGNFAGKTRDGTKHRTHEERIFKDPE